MATQLNQKSFQASNCSTLDAVAEALERLLTALGDPGDNGKSGAGGADGVTPVYFDRNTGGLVTPTDGADGVGGGSTGIGISDVINLEEGCAIRIEDDRINVDTVALAGQGLKVSDDEDCPALEANPGCGLYYDTAANDDNPPFAVNVEALAGIGLTAGEGSEDCPAFDVELIGGCGIEVTDATISVKPADLAGTGLVSRAGSCALHFEPDPQDCLTDTERLAGDGLRPGTEECTIEVEPSCGITVDENGVSVKAGDLVHLSSYLETAGDDCAIDVIPHTERVVVSVANLDLYITDDEELVVRLAVGYKDIEILQAPNPGPLAGFPDVIVDLVGRVSGEVC